MKTSIKKLIKTTTLVVIFILALYISINYGYRKLYITTSNNKPTVVIGGPKNQQAGLQKELDYAFKQVSHIEKGNVLLKTSKFDEAIAEFEIAYSLAKSQATRAEARHYIVDAYEKRRDYKKAADILKEMIKGYKVPPEDPFRIPEEERLKYLTYAAQGNYEMAIKHAEKALEADNNLPNRPKSGSPKYIERLNDLIAAKERILSLSKPEK